MVCTLLFIQSGCLCCAAVYLHVSVEEQTALNDYISYFEQLKYDTDVIHSRHQRAKRSVGSPLYIEFNAHQRLVGCLWIVIVPTLFNWHWRVPFFHSCVFRSISWKWYVRCKLSVWHVISFNKLLYDMYEFSSCCLNSIVNHSFMWFIVSIADGCAHSKHVQICVFSAVLLWKHVYL